jgi:Rieske 2Fe-2S family protein
MVAIAPMLTDTQHALLDRLAAGVRAGRVEMDDRQHTVPVEEYLNQDRFDRERAMIRANPVPVAPAALLAKKGTVLAHDHLGVPILLTRDRVGAPHAFLNVCRHRGTRLVSDDGPCRKGSLVCPYHQWTYGLDGALTNIPLAEAFPDVDPAAHGLAPLPLEERHGALWAVADPAGAIDLAGFLGGTDDELAVFGLDRMTFYGQHESRVAANWKLVFDAFFEAYHVHRLHHASLADFFADSHAVLDRAGQHIRAVIARRGYDGSLPARDKLRELVTFVFYLFPNTLVVVSPDYVNLLAMYPQSVDATVVVNTLLIDAPAETPEAEAHWAKSFDLICRVVFEGEDYRMAELGQVGLRSGANQAMTLGRFEYGVRLFHDVVDEALTGDGAPRAVVRRIGG